jgi:hypothetical protein
VRRFEIGGIQRAADTVTTGQLVHPGEAVEVVAVELARSRRSNCGETSLGSAREHGPVRHVGETSDRKRSRAHCVCEITAWRRLRGNAGAAAMAMDVDRDRVAQHGECRRGGLGTLRRLRRTAWSNFAGQHRRD